jgi:hypothetical protein
MTEDGLSVALRRAWRHDGRRDALPPTPQIERAHDFKYHTYYNQRDAS